MAFKIRDGQVIQLTDEDLLNHRVPTLSERQEAIRDRIWDLLRATDFATNPEVQLPAAVRARFITYRANLRNIDTDIDNPESLDIPRLPSRKS